nr:hypothetical protein BACY1_01470 [Tenacibaculum mesophilum]
MKKKDTAPKQDGVTRQPFPNSKKIYVQGKIHPQIKVAMREIELSDTVDSMTKKEHLMSQLQYTILQVLIQTPIKRLIFIMD